MVFKGGYHGSFLMFSTGCDSPVNAPFEYLMSEYNDTAAAEKLILQSKGSLACVIVEGMLGSSGCIPATPDFAQMLRRATLQVLLPNPAMPGITALTLHQRKCRLCFNCSAQSHVESCSNSLLKLQTCWAWHHPPFCHCDLGMLWVEASSEQGALPHNEAAEQTVT